MSGATIRLEVLAGDDPQRIERLTGDLGAALRADGRVHDAGAVIEARSAAVHPGGKGVPDVVAVLQASAPIAAPALSALVTAVVTWCARDRRTTVRLTEGERSIELTGDPSDAQKEAVDRFLRSDGPPAPDA